MKKPKTQLKFQKIILIFILLLAFFLRVYKIDQFPTGLNADEAAIGYNAYSLLQTGKDEFGSSWPVNFQSFNDYKPGLYFYLVLPVIKIFGLNEFSVRLPSVILGTLTILLLYLLIKNYWKNDVWALLSAFLLAISPWHIHFSRGGWESNAAVFFIVLGVYLFYKALERPFNFTLCAVSFALSMYTYHSARIISPLLLLGLVIFNRKLLFVKKRRRDIIIAVIIGIIVCLPLIKSIFSKEGTSRFSGVGIFTDQGPFWRVNELRGQHSDPFSIQPKLIHNKYFEYGTLFIDNYLRHYIGDFLFISGDEIQRNKVPEMGQMFLMEIPLLLLGLYFLIKNKPYDWKLMFYWLLIAPFASALTFQSPHAIRSLNMVIPLIIITAYGLLCLLELIKIKILNRCLAISLYCLIVLGFSWNISFYLHQYYVHYSQEYPSAWEDGFKQMVSYVEEVKGDYKNVYVTNKYDQPYILFAFYSKYPPKDFQKEAVLTPKDQYGFSTVDKFSNFNFGKIDLSQIPKGNNLIIGAPEEIPDSATILKKIYFHDGKTEAFRIIEN